MGKKLNCSAQVIEKKRQLRAEANRDPEFIEHVKKKLSKKYMITSPTGQIHFIRNLSEFCRTHELSVSNMCSAGKGKLKQHKGWKCKLMS